MIIIVLGFFFYICFMCALFPSPEKTILCDEYLPVTFTEKTPFSCPENMSVHHKKSAKYNISCVKTTEGFKGVIRNMKAIKSGEFFSWIELVKLDHKGVVQSFEYLGLERENFPEGRFFTNMVSYRGLEDGRLFYFNNELWIVADIFGHNDQIIKNKFSMVLFKADDIKNTFRMLYPEFIDNSINQKNWVPFQYKDRLYMAQSINPHKILDVTEQNITLVVETSFSVNDFPNINQLEKYQLRGGSPAILTRYGYLSVGHTYIRYSYLSFFYIFQTEYPFAIIYLSDMFKIQKADGIQFVSGLSIENDIVYVSFGINDNRSAIATFSLEDIMRLMHKKIHKISE